MIKKAVPYILLLLMAVLVIVIKRCTGTNESKSKQTSQTGNTQSVPSIAVNRDKGFDRRTSFLKFTEHARCRMQCRKISNEEIEEIMVNGKVNYKKSNLKDTRCPTYALEGVTRDEQRVRIVFGQCNEFTNVITVIDLETDWSCDCKGDGAKYENKN